MMKHPPISVLKAQPKPSRVQVPEDSGLRYLKPEYKFPCSFPLSLYNPYITLDFPYITSIITLSQSMAFWSLSAKIWTDPEETIYKGYHNESAPRTIEARWRHAKIFILLYRVILGLYRGYIEVMEKKMDSTISKENRQLGAMIISRLAGTILEGFRKMWRIW